MEEVWKDVKGYEGYYQISNYGRVKKISRIVGNKNLKYKKKTDVILKGYKNQRGYLLIKLINNTNVKTTTIHRLVAEAFIPNYNNLSQVNHKDENKSNNCVDNLEWCTAMYNNNYGNRNKKIKKNHNSIIYESIKKQIIQYDENMNKIQEFKSITDASKQNNINLGYISSCCNGKRKTAGGYIWKFL